MSSPPPPSESTEPCAETASHIEVPALRQIDDFVGARIRHRRCERGWTQERLAYELGISYQQVQKYETGANRINAGRLYQMAMSLEVDVAVTSMSASRTRTPSRRLSTEARTGWRSNSFATLPTFRTSRCGTRSPV